MEELLFSLSSRLGCIMDWPFAALGRSILTNFFGDVEAVDFRDEDTKFPVNVTEGLSEKNGDAGGGTTFSSSPSFCLTCCKELRKRSTWSRTRFSTGLLYALE